MVDQNMTGEASVQHPQEERTISLGLVVVSHQGPEVGFCIEAKAPIRLYDDARKVGVASNHQCHQ